MAVSKDHYIVAIGASAGGLEAIHQFFDHMKDGLNLSFVIIQHLSSDYKSLLVELVSRHTHMKVFEAESDLVIKKNCIYVIPNNKYIRIEKNKLKLDDKKHIYSPNNAIDTFLHSLAEDKKNKAIAIILSGTGSDGTKGIQAIKKKGGMVVVQDPKTAKFDGMPNSAIQLGITDYILSPAEMPEEIINYIQEPLLMKQQEFKEKDLEEIFSLIHTAVGFDFHYYKLPTLTRRITRRMIQVGYDSMDAYIDLLRKDKEECKQLGNDFLIGVTRFFRDKEAFSILQRSTYEDIVLKKADGDTIKVWVCACSTGEEAYSIAIMLNELVEQAGKKIDIKIFASDIDEIGIDIASKGIYPLTIEKDIDTSLIDKYFTRTGKNYQVTQRLRKQIVFVQHDVIQNPPFINNDMVTCRNMLIYMSSHLQQKIFSLLLFALSKNGILFLGSSEHSNYIRENVEEINGKWKIYRKVKENKIASHYLANIADRVTQMGDQRKNSRKEAPKPIPLAEAVQEAMTENLRLAAFFIDPSFNIIETHGSYETFLALPKKKLDLNLLGMIPPELYYVLSTEIKKSWKENIPVTLKNIKTKKSDKIVSWQILIKPMKPYTLVMITEQDVNETETEERLFIEDPRKINENYISSLEEELEKLRNNLEVAVEDLESTNEELQSSNEELLSANEELQSSNEELQSLNEELHTLNTEYQMKIRELVELNDDLNNYFRSTDIAQVFLDNDLHIRKFNPASSHMINFIDSDIGRPISHISNNIQYEDFLPAVENVRRNGEIFEKEVMLENGKNLLMRIMPYINRAKEINGVIITFVDISTITHLNNIIRAVLNSSPGVILAFNAVRSNGLIKDFTLQIASHAAGAFLDKSATESAGASLKKDISWLSTQQLFEQYVKVVENDDIFQKDIYFEHLEKWYTVIIAKMMDGFVATFSDITSKKRSEQKLKKNYLELMSAKDILKKTNEQLEKTVFNRTRALAESEERFRLVARATNDALWDWDLVNNTVWWGETFFKLFGYENSNEITNRNFWLEKIHPDDRKRVNDSLFEVINSSNSQWSREYRFLKDNGEYAFILDRAYILHDEFGTPYRMLGSMFDVTDLKNAEKKLSTLNEQLENKVTERTKELELMNSALEVSNNDLQQFASVASHDLQEPLRKIQMFAEMIQDSSEARSDGPIRHQIHKIMHSSKRMRSLITDILNYSRLSASDSRFEPVNLTTLIQDILDDFEFAIQEKSAVIHLGELPVLEVIEGQMRQVFLNLISNALKFSRPFDSPVITITSKNLAKKSFTGTPQKDGRYCMITITDNGIGFSPEFSQNIFQLFQRLHSKDKYEGTGIGLAVTKKIIEKHDGLIKAVSEENKGASFSIILPVKQTPQD